MIIGLPQYQSDTQISLNLSCVPLLLMRVIMIDSKKGEMFLEKAVFISNRLHDDISFVMFFRFGFRRNGERLS